MKGLFLLTLALAFSASGFAADPLRASFTLKGKNPEPAYIVDAMKSKLVVSKNASGNPKLSYPLSMVTEVKFEEYPGAWKEAESLWAKRDYKNAYPLYRKLSSTYRTLVPLKDQFAAVSRFRYLECARELEKYADLAKDWTTLKKSYLSEHYHPQIDLFSGWAAYGKALKGDKAAARRLFLITEEFAKAGLPPEQSAQAAYLRGFALAGLERQEEALSEYTSACTLGFGSDQNLQKKAMERALTIYQKDKELDLIVNRWKKREAYSLGHLYRSRFFRSGKVAASYRKFTEPMPKDLDETLDP